MEMLNEETLGDYANRGYSIKERGEDSIAILFKGVVIAVFNQPKVTPKEIQDVCRRHKESLMAAKI